MQRKLDLRPVIETRFELPASRTSWREESTVVEVRTYPMCWDIGWSFWRPFREDAVGSMTRTRIA